MPERSAGLKSGEVVAVDAGAANGLAGAAPARARRGFACTARASVACTESNEERIGEGWSG